MMSTNSCLENIINAGADEARLPQGYVEYLRGIPTYLPPADGRTRVGADIFLSIWGPIMALMEKVTKSNLQPDGNAPAWVVRLVRLVVWMVWLSHDYIFAPIFGRGDGLGSGTALTMSTLEKQSLLPKKESSTEPPFWIEPVRVDHKDSRM